MMMYTLFNKVLGMNKNSDMETIMLHTLSLKQAEQKAFAAHYRDGMWDILVGYIVMVFAIAPFLRAPMGDTWSVAIFFPIGIAVWIALLLIRKYVVLPRAGGVVLSQARRRRMSWVFFGLFVVHFGARLLGYDLLELAEDPGWATSARFGILVLALFSIPAFFLKFRRLYIYGFLAAASPLLGEVLYRQWGAAHHGHPIVFGATAAIIILTGVVLFVRVLRGGSVLTSEAMSEDV
jgi:hypothetical protein